MRKVTEVVFCGCALPPLQRVPSFLGSCVTGYVGERCQFSDLEWWEQQRAGRAKVRNIAITACAAALALLLLLLGLLAAYCHRYCCQAWPKRDMLLSSWEFLVFCFSFAGSVNNTESSGTSLVRRTHVGVSEQTRLEGRRIDFIGGQEHVIYFFLGFPAQL